MDALSKPDWGSEVGPRFIGQRRNDVTRLFVKYPPQTCSPADIEKAFKDLPSVMDVERKAFVDRPEAIFVQ